MKIEVTAQWDDGQIREFYDLHWNMQLSELAQITGKPVNTLKDILMPKEDSNVTQSTS
jgi:putative hemolysin